MAMAQRRRAVVELPEYDAQELQETLETQEMGSDEHESSSSSEDDEHEVPLKVARADAVYDVIGLNEKLADIAWPANVAWIHSLAVTKATDKDADVEDDLAREMSFYTLGLDGAREAYEKLQAMKVPFLRPEDYYAEMVKSDVHMHKVKEVLVTQQKQLEEQQERRKAREAKKFSKEVQAEKIKERNKQKKQDIESVKKWRKMRKDSDFTRGEDEFPMDLDGSNKKKQQQGSSSGGKRKRGAPAPWDRSGGKDGGNNKRGPSKSRQQRDAKFGHGGRKGMNKRNTASSSAAERPRKQQKRH